MFLAPVGGSNPARSYPNPCKVNLSLITFFILLLIIGRKFDVKNLPALKKCLFNLSVQTVKEKVYMFYMDFKQSYPHEKTVKLAKRFILLLLVIGPLRSKKYINDLLVISYQLTNVKNIEYLSVLKVDHMTNDC